MPSDVQFVQCLHCDRNQRRRFRARLWWTCRFCGKKNPGPVIVKQLLGEKLKIEPEPTAKLTNGASTPVGVAATIIQSGKSKEAPTSAPPAAKKEAPTAPVAVAAPVQKGRSLLGRVMHG